MRLINTSMEERMSKIKAFLSLIGAIVLAAVLILGWDMIGDGYIVLEFLPNVKLLSVRLGLVLTIIYLAGMGIWGLAQRSEQTQTA
jgi:hypothetical protein